MKHVGASALSKMFSIAVVIAMSGPSGFAQVTGTGCSNPQSSECRIQVASMLQNTFKTKFPEMRVRVLADIIVFSDPKLFDKQDDRHSYLRVLQDSGMQMQLCTVGFKGIRLESSVAATSAATSNGEYDLRCSGTGPTPPPKAQVSNGSLSTPTAGQGVDFAEKGSQEHGADGELTGKVFLITRGGDLKPARFAQIVLLYGADAGTPAVMYLNNKLDNMKASYQALVSPGDASCRAELLVVIRALETTLEWVQASGKYDRSRVSESDEEGSFRFAHLQPGPYLLVARGQAGANDAYWEQDVTIETGKRVVIKVSTPNKACLDY